MPSINEVATQKVFAGLKCAYTGLPVTVRVVACGAMRPMFFSPDAFDPSVPMPELPVLLRKAGARNGIEGSVSGDNVLVCPYTGNRMAIAKDASGFYLTGGFRPSCPCPDPAMFAHSMRMRGGVSDSPAPEKASISFQSPKPQVIQHADLKPKDYSMAYAEDALKSVLPKKCSVTVPDPGPRKRRRA